MKSGLLSAYRLLKTVPLVSTLFDIELCDIYLLNN